MWLEGGNIADYLSKLCENRSVLETTKSEYLFGWWSETTKNKSRVFEQHDRVHSQILPNSPRLFAETNINYILFFIYFTLDICTEYIYGTVTAVMCKLSSLQDLCSRQTRE
jgi:hypothetical protein